MQLYKQDKYQVLLGKGNNIAFCTVWNEPKQVQAIIGDEVAIIGSLYSRLGVNIILRNLALNPHIRKLYVWGNGTLSNTEFGLMGKNILLAIWQNKMTNHTVGQTTFKIDAEISLSVINKIRENVELIDISHLPIEQIKQNLKKEKLTAYMKPTSFPDSKIVGNDPFPSEEVGFLVRDENILKTWLKVVEKVMRYGTIKGTQYGYQQKELIGVNWIIDKENPENLDLSIANNWPENLKKITGATSKDIKEYCKIFLNPQKQPGISYTYGNRLMNYPLFNEKLDQIEEVIIKQLKDSPNSRRAVATTLVPGVDSLSNEPPCITQVQALQNNGQLHLLVTIRSHDIFKAALPNAYGLRVLQKKIADKLGFNIGKLQISSQSAHIYEQDWDQALKLVKCQFWENQPNNEFIQDARGNVIISIKQAIIIELQDKNGINLIKITGKSANELIKKLNHLSLISTQEHAFYLGAELQKAEIALKNKISYHQDKPLVF